MLVEEPTVRTGLMKAYAMKYWTVRKTQSTSSWTMASWRNINSAQNALPRWSLRSATRVMLWKRFNSGVNNITLKQHLKVSKLVIVRSVKVVIVAWLVRIVFYQCLILINVFLLFSAFRRHNQRLSIKSGSWFYGSNITLAESLKAIYMWSVGLTQSQVRRELPLAKQTVGDIFCFLREICATVVIANAEPLGGLDANGNPIVVEIDESKFGKIKYNRVCACVCGICFAFLTFTLIQIIEKLCTISRVIPWMEAGFSGCSSVDLPSVACSSWNVEMLRRFFQLSPNTYCQVIDCYGHFVSFNEGKQHDNVVYLRRNKQCFTNNSQTSAQKLW